MSHRSGIKVDDDLKKDFASIQQDSKVLYVEIRVKDDKFIKGVSGSGSADEKAWAVLQNLLKPRTPTYIVTRAGAPDGKWVLIFYVPEDSLVKEKMIYASSVSALKEGLGSNLFANEFAISTAKECNAQEFNVSTHKFAKEDIMTTSETLKQEAKDLSSKEASDTKQQAMADIPLAVSDDATKELAKLKAGAIDLVVLSIDMKTEILQHCAVSLTTKISLDDIIKGGYLPEKEPRYLIYRYAHLYEEKQQSSIVFLYYCPDIATPRNKMTYSAMKQNVSRIAENAGI